MIRIVLPKPKSVHIFLDRTEVLGLEGAVEQEGEGIFSPPFFDQLSDSTLAVFGRAKVPENRPFLCRQRSQDNGPVLFL